MKSEDDPLDPSPPAQQSRSLEAIRYLERRVTTAAPIEGSLLRYGSLYGPGTSMAVEYAQMIRERKLPLVGSGSGIWSFTHVDDAASATVLAVDRGAPGLYNVVDDDPAPVAEWLPYLSECLGAGPPPRSGLAGPRGRRRGRGLDDDRDPRLLEREGEGGAPAGARPGEAGARASGTGSPTGRFGGRMRRRAMHSNPSSLRVEVAEAFEDLRPLLFSISYRMLGSVAEVEDIVQESFVRYHRALLEQDAEIDSPKAYLSAVTTRLAIDHLRSARARKESYVGEWLPEPLLTDERAPDGARHAEDADSLSVAFLLLLERLSPVERAVFLLHDIFGYGYDEVAAIVGKSETTAVSSLCARAATSRNTSLASRPRVASATGSRIGSSARSRRATWIR